MNLYRISSMNSISWLLMPIELISRKKHACFFPKHLRSLLQQWYRMADSTTKRSKWVLKGLPMFYSPRLISTTPGGKKIKFASNHPDSAWSHVKFYSTQRCQVFVLVRIQGIAHSIASWHEKVGRWLLIAGSNH